MVAIWAMAATGAVLGTVAAADAPRSLLLNFDLAVGDAEGDSTRAQANLDHLDLPDSHPEVAPGASVDACPGQQRAASAGRSACYALEDRGDFSAALECYRTDASGGGAVSITLVSLERQAVCLRALGRHPDAVAALTEATALFGFAPEFSGRCDVVAMLGDSLEKVGDLSAAVSNGWRRLGAMAECTACSRLGLWETAAARLARLAHAAGELAAAEGNWSDAVDTLAGCQSDSVNAARAAALCLGGLSALERAVSAADTQAPAAASAHYASALAAAAVLSDDAGATELLQLATAGAAAAAAPCTTSWPLPRGSTTTAHTRVLRAVWAWRCEHNRADALARLAAVVADEQRPGGLADVVVRASAQRLHATLEKGAVG